MNKHALLISIRPRFAEMIFAGTKTVELRRVCPKVSEGDLALIYVSAPTKELRGGFEIGNVISSSPLDLWKRIGKQSGTTREEFIRYFRGKTEAHALIIKRVWKLSVPICLIALRRHNARFQPPQNFRYLNRIQSPYLAPSEALQIPIDL